MKLRDQVAQEIEQFMVTHELPPATFGRLALSDPTFVFDVREGRDLKSETIDRIREFMASYRPLKARSSGNARAQAAA